MKKEREISLAYSFVGRSRARSGEGASWQDTPGSLAGADGHYGFSRSWTWTHEIPVPANWDGNPVSVTLSVTADDSATLTLGDLSVSAHYDSESQEAGTNTATGRLFPGVYEASLSYTNIDYTPPKNNVAVLDYSISTGTPGTIVPEDDRSAPEDDDCGCDARNSDAGGEAPSAGASRNLLRSRAESDSSEEGFSSAGQETRLDATPTFAHWRTSFGAFRGLGGIAAGTLEILAYEDDADALASPALLEWRHVLGSRAVLPASGVSAGAQFKIFLGGSFTSWLCDGSGGRFFPVGRSSPERSRVRWSEDKTRIEQVFPDESVAAFSAETGELVSYRTKNGNALTAEEISAYADVVRDENGVFAQAWNLWDGLANVENVSESGYEIALYAPPAVGGKDASTGRYSVSGTAFKRFVVSLSESGKLTITEQDSRDGARAFPRAFRFENGAWNVSAGTGEEEIFTRVEKTALSAKRFRLVKEVSRGAENVPASRVEEIYEETASGELCVSRTEGFGEDCAQTTLYDYDDAGRRIREQRADGGVFERSYDARGRVSAVYEPKAGFRCVRTYFDYANADSNSDELSAERRVISGASKHFELSRTTYARSETSEYRREERRTTALGSTLTRLEVEETWSGDCGNAFARGRVKMRQAENGVQTHYDYAATDFAGALYAETRETRVAGVPVNGLSERETRFISPDGNVLRTEKRVLDTAGTWRLVSSADYEYDSRNRETKRTRGNGRVYQREMMCCGVLWEIDEDGVRTNYFYDSARQLTEKMRADTATSPERTTIYERDASGRVTRETLQLDSVVFSEKTTAFDLLGRVVSETDELGRTTSRAYATDAAAQTTTETATLPSGATLTEVRHADGAVLLEAGTARRGVQIVIDSVSDGVRTTRRIAGTTNDAGILSREIENGFGETIRTVAPNALGGLIYTNRTFDSLGRLSRSVTGTLAPELYEYDAFGNETKRTLALADSPTALNSRVRETETFYENRETGVYRVVSTTTYDATGAARTASEATLASESASLESETISTDVRGNATRRTTEYGTPTERVIKNRIPGASNVAETRVVDGFTVSVTDHAGTTTTFARRFVAGENAGTAITTTDGRGNATVEERDVSGRTRKTTDATGAVTTIEYDAGTGKPSCVTDALGNTVRRAYDLRGNVVAEFGTGTQPAVFAYDDADRKISQKLFRAEAESADEDPRSRTDGDETTWSYDAATGLLLRKTYPDGNSVDYVYDEYNRLSSTELSREVSEGVRLKISRTYAALTGELVSVSCNDGTASATCAYDFLGQLVSETDAAGTRAYRYDGYGARISETFSGGLFASGKEIAYHFDEYGRDVGYSIDGVRKTRVDYDAATGRVASFAFTGAGTFAWEYSAGTSLKSKLTYPNGATAEWSYESARDLLAGVKNTVNGSVISQYAYGNDALGRRVSLAKSGSMMKSAETIACGYDARSELVSAVSASDPAYDYAYGFDAVGNRETSSESGTSLVYSANALNQYSEIAGGEAFVPEYDADGDMTKIATSTGTWTIERNAQNRPVTWTKSTGEKIFMMYDAHGRRVEKRVLNAAGTRTLRERYVYVGYTCVQILNGDDGNALVKEFAWDPTEPVATRPLAFRHAQRSLMLFYAHDGNKNVSDVFFLALQNGVGAHYDYAPFGAIVRSSRATPATAVNIIEENPFRFSSEFYDSELGLVYYNYRHYSPDLGRFLSRDPVEEQGGLNLYAFVKNQSETLVDWLGLAEALIWKICECPNWQMETTVKTVFPKDFAIETLLTIAEDKYPDQQGPISVFRSVLLSGSESLTDFSGESGISVALTGSVSKVFPVGENKGIAGTLTGALGIQNGNLSGGASADFSPTSNIGGNSGNIGIEIKIPSSQFLPPGTTITVGGSIQFPGEDISGKVEVKINW